jgi:hypothetical protein
MLSLLLPSHAVAAVATLIAVVVAAVVVDSVLLLSLPIRRCFCCCRCFCCRCCRCRCVCCRCFRLVASKTFVVPFDLLFLFSSTNQHLTSFPFLTRRPSSSLAVFSSLLVTSRHFSSLLVASRHLLSSLLTPRHRLSPFISLSPSLSIPLHLSSISSGWGEISLQLFA